MKDFSGYECLSIHVINIHVIKIIKTTKENLILSKKYGKKPSRLQGNS